MAQASPPELLVLHAVRLKGMVDAGSVVDRFSIDHGVVEGLIRKYEASGLIDRVEFADLSGWTLTDAGRAEDSRLLAEELDAIGARDSIAASHDAFVEINGPFLAAVTKWQLRPIHGDPLAANDHSDWRWDERVLRELERNGWTSPGSTRAT